MWVYTLLPEILNMSITAGIIIIVVLLARIPLRKAPKIFSYALWAVVLFRLICPVSFSSEFSLLGLFHAPTVTEGSITYIPADIVHTESPQVDLPIPAINKVINEKLPQGAEQTVADPLEWQMAAATLLWLCGVAAMLLYSVVSLMLLRRKLIGTVRLRDNIYLADHIATPFVIGVVRPKIYLPSSLAEQEQSYIILHEQTHIRRLDHIVKMIAFLALAVHWFNPLVWVAFVSCAKDMEMSCDERVLKEMGSKIKGAYSTSLLSLATGRRLINGSPLAFGEGNIKERIKNVMNFKKPAAWVIVVSVLLVAALSIGFAANSTTKLENEAGTGKEEQSLSSYPAKTEEFPSTEKDTTGGLTETTESTTVGLSEAEYSTEYSRVIITFLSENIGAKSVNEFETTDSNIVAYVDTTIRNSLVSEKEPELNKNYINQYTVKLYNDIGGYSCSLYYDTLYNKAYIVRDGGLSETTTDFARYIDSFLENTDITIWINDADVISLFQKYGWTLDYKIGAMKNKLNNISVLTGFNPNAYYFAYNNELSKDIGLDMSKYSNSADIDIDIYRIHESMPLEFYPVQNCRGIVVKEGGKIIGAFISAGRHRTFNACSLKGNSFEKAAGKTLDEWLADTLIADDNDKRLSKLEPEQVIEEYFAALGKKDARTAGACISKKTQLGNLTANMPNNELFREELSLLLTDSNIGNLKSAKLLKVELLNESDKNTKTFRVTVDLQYKEVISINNGEQYWDCTMVYESAQTGWKIAGFGH